MTAIPPSTIYDTGSYDSLQVVNTISLGSQTGSITLSASSGSYPLVLPPYQGIANTFLRNDGSGNLIWAVPADGGNVMGPSSPTTPNGIALWYDTTGTILKNSTVTITGNDIANVSSLGLFGNVKLQPAGVTTAYTLTMPPAQGSSNSVMLNDGTGTLTWKTLPVSVGDVTGPGSSTQNGIALYANTTGKLLKNSTVTITGNDIANVSSLDFSGGVRIEPAGVTASYTLTMPPAQSVVGINSVLTNDGTGALSWTSTGLLPPTIGPKPATYGLTMADQGKNFIYTTGGGVLNYTNGSVSAGFYCYVKNGSNSDIDLQYNGVAMQGVTARLHRATGSGNSTFCMLYYDGTNLWLY